jgi:two-component system chemotaxis response regulator CheB
MARHDVVVIGASSGGVPALTALVGGLPGDLPASVFIVLHVPEDAKSQLPTILNRAGRLPAAHAVDQEPIRLSRIYIAPPGHQMYVRAGRLSVVRGPRENRHRPAVDPLFRTAAAHYGARVIGVILSGAMDDGSAGLEAVKRAGGLAVVQDPEDAGVSAMPANALEAVEVDYCKPVAELGSILVRLVGAAAGEAGIPGEVPLETEDEAAPDDEAAATPAQLGTLVPFTCPECQGPMWQIDDSGKLRFRCRVGHGYSSDSMVTAQGDNLERALWSAFRALEERRELLSRLVEDARRRGHDAVASRFEDRRRQIEAEGRQIHSLIVNGRALEPVDVQAS